MVKIRFFALFLAAQLSSLFMDCAIAMDTLPEPSEVSSASSPSMDPVAKIRLPVHPSFSVHYRLQHQPSRTVLDEARVLYSQEGIRVEQLLDQSANVFIANYADEKFWFVDRKRQLAHSVPVIATQPSILGPGYAGIVSMAGFIQLSPCVGLEGITAGTGNLHGRRVQKWTCMDGGEVVEEQWYAPSPGVVLRSLDSHGYISELTDLHERETHSLNFRPPSHYRKVSIDVLMNPSEPIGSYIEQSREEKISP